MRRTLALVAGLMAAGCAPATLEELRQHADRRYAFDVGQSYEQIYQHIAATVRQCWAARSGEGPAFVVDSDFDPGGERGRVTVRYTSMQQQVLMNIDIEKAGSASRVTVISYPPVERSPEVVRGWAFGSTQCY